MRKIIPTIAASLAAALALTACGSSTPSTTPSDTGAPTTSESAEAPTGEVTVVKVGASPVPHQQILEYIDENLAADAGIDLEITPFDDYVLPNEALADGTLDANYFQHLPYLEEEIATKGYAFEHGAGVHIEPLSLFSSKHAEPAAVPDGGLIAITNDVTNQNRALKLLEKAGLLANIDDAASVLSLTDEQNPKGLQFEETNPEIVVTLIDDPKVDAAVVNSNFILTAGLNTEDAIDVEAVEGNPYANILAWRTDNTNEGVAVLEGLLHSPEVAEFIRTTWPSGNVLPGAAS
ncbi:MetQ/NlpA family ABC transporter substrate-binding protein [Tessaracoccus caeni]|uniref:MetQ/NlpA family ABC transporter substrate-binding protein n=1 Tax=Tessaracoccus caeni TaxID=3031239 RepID=UPI0023DA9121|nr:MetQ/NlpA family ABC transporter substrate-binding protein [Tessaracoccus caeni]MDF1487540.1 MetQ/NlpA family ABC transporter substrate-binding protein [Tessaracoccus caeni]